MWLSFEETSRICVSYKSLLIGTQCCSGYGVNLLRGLLSLHLHTHSLKSFSVSHRLDSYSHKEDASAFPGKRALISFLSWFDYCDQLIKEAQKVKILCYLLIVFVFIK